MVPDQRFLLRWYMLYTMGHSHMREALKVSICISRIFFAKITQALGESAEFQRSICVKTVTFLKVMAKTKHWGAFRCIAGQEMVRKEACIYLL